MPKFQFVEVEETVAIITFEAESLDHAQELMEEVLDWSDLPNSERFYKNGNTNWEYPEESKDN